MSHSVFIKNMVGNSCKLKITQLFNSLNLHPTDVFLGGAILQNLPTKSQLQAIKLGLEQNGYELITDNRIKIVAKIKFVLVQLIESETFSLKVNISEYISSKLHYEYHYLSNLFSEVENISIEKYFIVLKTQKAKQYLNNKELNISEIAYKLAYSSHAHFTNQFKQITGVTPTQFRTINLKKT